MQPADDLTRDLRACLEQLEVACTKYKRYRSNEMRWTPRIDMALTKICDQRLEFYRCFGNEFTAKEAAEEKEKFRSQTREQRLISRLQQNRKHAETQASQRYSRLRQIAVSLAKTPRDSLATKDLFDQLSTTFMDNFDDVRAVVDGIFVMQQTLATTNVMNQTWGLVSLVAPPPSFPSPSVHVPVPAAPTCNDVAANPDSDNVGGQEGGEIKDQIAGTTKAAPTPEAEPRAQASRDARKEERRKRRDDYKALCMRQGVKVTDEMIAQAASPKWHSRTTIQKWIACDPRYDGEADRLIRRVFARKHHIPPKP